MKNKVYLSLGSNVDRERTYPRAVALLTGLGTVAAVSQVYETRPVGMDDADNFFNGAVLLLTDLTPADLKRRLRDEVEAPLGRRRDPDNRFTPRTIDVDITLWNDDVLEVGDQSIPDPDLLRHVHVAVPLAELAPNLIHPETGQTLRDIADGLLACDPVPPRLRPDIRLEFD